MVFKRREKRTFLRSIGEFFYPRTGWARATRYIMHRLHRLPDTPKKIAIGVGVGVYVSFTPLFGFHFIIAALLALLFRGNIIAAILGTFFGNPLTFPFIATISFKLGSWFLGAAIVYDDGKSAIGVFRDAFLDLWHNFVAIFGPSVVDWSHLTEFFVSVFLPYLVGGTIPGILAGIAAYFISRPVIAAYQHRRKGRLLSRWKERRAAKTNEADRAHRLP